MDSHILTAFKIQCRPRRSDSQMGAASSVGLTQRTPQAFAGRQRKAVGQDFVGPDGFKVGHELCQRGQAGLGDVDGLGDILCYCFSSCLRRRYKGQGGVLVMFFFLIFQDVPALAVRAGGNGACCFFGLAGWPGIVGLLSLGFANPTYDSDLLALFLIAACARGVWAGGLFDGYFGW
jgi:hypothetical protein